MSVLHREKTVDLSTYNQEGLCGRGEPEGTRLAGGEMLEGLLLPTVRREGCVLIPHSQTPARGAGISVVCAQGLQ